MPRFRGRRSLSKKRSFSRGKKRTFSRKKFGGRKRFKKGGSGFAKRVKDVVMKQLTADSSYVYSYADAASTTGTLDAVAEQLLWADNHIASGTFAAGALTNLMLDDCIDLQTISAAINSTKTVRFTVKSRWKEVAITNMANCAIEFWEYRCQSRRDQLTLPDATLRNGFADATVGAGTLPTFTTIGVTPFMNPRFVAENKVLKVRKWLLQPAQRKVIRYKLSKPRQYNTEVFAPDGIAKQIMRGQRFSVFGMCGTYSSNGSAAAGKRNGVGIAAVGLIYKVGYHYSWINDVQGERGSTTNLYGFTAGISGTSAGFAPHPIVTNHPDSAIATTTWTGGVPSNITAGDRVNDQDTETRYAVGVGLQTS